MTENIDNSAAQEDVPEDIQEDSLVILLIK